MPATFKEYEGADDDAKITPQQAPRGAVKQAAGAPAAVATADATYRGPCKRRKKRAMLSKWATAHVTVLTRGALLVFPHDPANAPKDMIGDHAIDLLANGGADVAMGPADATSAEVSISGFDVLANEAATVTLQLRTPADAENLRMCILQASRPPGTFGASNASPAPKAPAPPPPPPPSPPASIPKKPPPPPPPKRDKSAPPPPPPPPKRDETAEPSESASISAFAQAQKSAEKAKKKDAKAEEESAETAPKSPESTTAAEPAGSSEEPAVRERRYSVNTANRLLNEKEEEADKTRERLAKMYKHASAVASRVGAEVPEQLAKAAVTAVAARAASTPPSASEPDGSSKPRERRYTINTANRLLEETEEEVDTSKKALVGMFRSTKEVNEKEAAGVSSEPPQTQEAEKAEESRERQPSTAAMNAAEAVWASAQEDMGIAPSPLFRSYPSPSAPSTMATPTPIAVVQEAPPASKPSPASSSQRRASVSFDPSVESASEAPIPPVAPVGGILKSSTHPHADSQEPSHGQANNGRRLSVNSANARVEALESRLEMAVEKAKNGRAALSADKEQQQDHGDGRPQDADASNNQVTRARRMTVNSANARVELLDEHVAAAKIAAVQLRDKLATADTDAVEEAARNAERAAMPPPRPEPSSRMHSESTVQAVFDAAEASVGTEQDEEAKKSSDATTGSARLDRRFSVNTANDLLAEQLERAAAIEAALKETQQTLQQFLLETTRKLLDERNSPGHASVAAAYTKENPSPQSEIKSAPPASPQSTALPESAFSDPASVYEEAKRMARMQRAGRAHTDSPSFTIHRPPPTPQVPSYLSPSLHSPMQQARSAMYSGSQIPMTPQPPAPQPPAPKPAAPQPPVSVDEALATFAEGEAAFLSLLERSSPMSGTASQQQPPPATVGSVGDYQYPPQHSPAYYQPAPPSPGSGPPTPGSASRHYHSDLRTLSNIHHTNRSAIVASSGGDLLGEEVRKLALHAVVLKPMSPYSTDTKMTSAVAMGVAPLMFRASSLKNLTSGGSSGRPPTMPSSSHSLYPHGWHTSDEYYQASARKSGGASITTEPRPVNDPYPSAGYPERMLSLGKQGKRAAGEVAAVVAGRGRGMYSDAYYDAEADAKSEAAQLLAASNRLTDDVHAGWGIASPAEQRADSSPGLLAEAEAEAALAAAELTKRGDRSLNTDPMSPGSFDAMNTILAKSYLPDSFDAWRAQQRRREEEQHWARYRRYQASHFPHHGA